MQANDQTRECEFDRKRRRRSRRIRARIRITVRTQGQNKQAISEETDALIVNAHGALILLAAAVGKNQFVTIVNTKTREELLARVTEVGQRFMGKAQVGVEFIRPAPDFWGIVPRPKDWNSASVLATPPAVPQKV